MNTDSDSVSDPVVVGEKLSSTEIAWRVGMFVVTLTFEIGLFGVAGIWLDRQTGSVLFTPLFLGAGMIVATVALIRFAQRWTPKAKRSKNQLLDDDEPIQNDDGKN